MAMNANPIGVFDSGVGGLTVLKALRDALPRENFIYLGDTARLPYGTKGAGTVTQYALQAAQLLMGYDVKILVVACNTATALALPSLQNLLPQLPCLGVIEPSARKAAELSATGRIAVLSTEGTARSGAYAAAIGRYRADAEVRQLGCNLLVALAEEGWCDGVEAESVIARYLHELGDDFDTLVLGCTHFPALAPTLRKLIRPEVPIVDSATATAEVVRCYLMEHALFNDGERKFQVDRPSPPPLAGGVRGGVQTRDPSPAKTKGLPKQAQVFASSPSRGEE
jgi:glutamate racemase